MSPTAGWSPALCIHRHHVKKRTATTHLSSQQKKKKKWKYLFRNKLPQISFPFKQSFSFPATEKDKNNGYISTSILGIHGNLSFETSPWISKSANCCWHVSLKAFVRETGRVSNTKWRQLAQTAQHTTVHLLWIYIAKNAYANCRSRKKQKSPQSSFGFLRKSLQP